MPCILNIERITREGYQDHFDLSGGKSTKIQYVYHAIKKHFSIPLKYRSTLMQKEKKNFNAAKAPKSQIKWKLDIISFSC